MIPAYDTRVPFSPEATAANERHGIQIRRMGPCKTRRGRINRAVALLKAGWAGHSRSFDDCFENHDGHEVWEAVQERCAADPDLERAFLAFFKTHD